MLPPSPDILTRYLANTCTDDERRQVEFWYDTFDSQLDLFKMYPDTKQATYQQELFRRVEAAIRSEQTPVIPLWRLQKRWLYTAAASLAGVILLTGLWFQRVDKTPVTSGQAGATLSQATVLFTTITNSQSKVVAQQLPDGSTVWLNPQAVIRFPKQFSGPTRNVAFRGEGFFEVQKDPRHPFIIHSGQMTTRVLGTSFNVRANPDRQQYEVAVVTGRVAVQLQSTPNEAAKTLILIPHQKAIYSAGQADLVAHSTINAQKQAAYEPVSIAFNWVPLDEVVRRLEIVYAVKIELAEPTMKNCRLQADFTNERLPVIMETISRSVNASYSLTDDTITLRGTGCEN